MQPGMKLKGISIVTKSGTKEIKNGATVKLNKGDQIFIDYRYTKNRRMIPLVLERSVKIFTY